MVHGEPADSKSYEVYFENQQLKLDDNVPLNTAIKQPVILRKTQAKKYTPVLYHIVVDNSNVYIGAQNILNKDTNKVELDPCIRVNVTILAKILEENKLKSDIQTRIVGGSSLKKNEHVWDIWKASGYQCIVVERTSEQHVNRSYVKKYSYENKLLFSRKN